MARYTTTTASLFLALTTSASVVAAEPSLVTETSLRLLFNEYCISCHSDARHEGELNLEAFGERRWGDQGLLNVIAQRIDAGEMPPKDAKLALPDVDRTKLLKILSGRLVELGEVTAPGTYQKLTAAEYNHTLLDLFGEPLDNPQDLPVDAEGEIKKIGERQVITSYAVDKYFEISRRYLDRVILVEASKPLTTRYTTADTRDVFGTKSFTPAAAMAGDWDKYHRNRSFNIDFRNPATSFALEGEYEINFDWHCFYLPPQLGLKRADTFGYHSLGSRTTEPTPPLRPEYGYHSQKDARQDVTKWVQVDLGKPTPIEQIVYVGCHDEWGGIGAGFGFPVRYKIEVSDDREFNKDVTLVLDHTKADMPNPGVEPQIVKVGNGGESAPPRARYVRFTATKLAHRVNAFIFALAELKVFTPTGENAAAGATVTALDSIEAPVRWTKMNLVDGYFVGAPAASSEAVKWVQVDLGSTTDVSKVVLRPCHQPYPRIGAGYGFPVRFAIDVSADGQQWERIANQTEEDFPNPGMTPYQVADRASKQGRYVRVSVMKLPDVGGQYAFALAELQVLDAKGRNLALGKQVTASDSRESRKLWAAQNLTDGKFAEWYPEPDDGIRVKANDVNYWNEFIHKDNNRKTFQPPGAWEALFHYDRFERAEPLVTPVVSSGSAALSALNAVGEKRGSLFRLDQPLRVRLDSSEEFLHFNGPGNEFKGWTHYIRFSGDEVENRLREIGKADLPKEEKEIAKREMRNTILREWRQSKEMWLTVTGATFRGPLHKKEPPTHELILGNLLREDGMPQVRKTIDRLASRLFRRPADGGIVTEYYDIAGKEYERNGGNAYGAVKMALNAMLCSPRFLFKHQGSGPELDDYMIASRLSYFLWDSTPDEMLLDLAAKGRLKDPRVRREQALRLLEDRERSGRFVDSFVHQWLGLETLSQIAPNSAYMKPETFTKLRTDLTAEPKAFFDHLLRNNLGATNFIHSNFVVWNDPLLKHYQHSRARFPKPARGEEPIPNEIFRPLHLSETDTEAMTRGGLLTMASVLCMTSDGENQRPVLRGAWIARHLLGMEIDPPDTVPAIEVTLENVSKPREILKRHKEDRSCYVCHVKFDHLGLALENYDLLGKWRSNYVYPALDSEGKRFELVEKDVVDSRAETPDGEPMHGVAGLKQHLLANRDKVMRSLVEKLFSYAIGREVRYLDHEQLKGLSDTAKQNDYRLRDLIVGLVACDAFAKR